jgi:hypothetical protein
MHRSSESIGTMAAALAKAQAELTNPDKSLVAIIRSPFPRESDRIFRYAPLSSGLEIVRKSLSRHEIAMVQTTEIDKDAGLVRLTTVLVHSSGEWLSSEWPVCAISDTGSPQRMGAALTYARRYALFTLVGIAGENDLDAPDLGAIPKAGIELPPRSDHRSQMKGQAAAAERPSRDGGKPSVRSAKFVLAQDESAILRERLVEQVAAINSTDDAAAWAHRNLPAKNTLTAADPKLSRNGFRQDSRQSAMAPASHPMLSTSKARCPPLGLMRPLARKFQRSPTKRLTKARSVRWAKWLACAIRSIGRSSPGSHAWSVAERRLIPITFGLSSLVRWAAGSVTSSRYHCVASITVSSTARAMRLHGGASSPSILYQSRSDYGSTRGSMARSPGSVEASSLDLQPRRKRRSNAKPRPSIQAWIRELWLQNCR